MQNFKKLSELRVSVVSIKGNHMARFTRLEVYQAMFESGLVPLFYNPDVEVSKKVTQACAAGGARVLEFTNRGDFAFEVFKELSQSLAAEKSPLMLGVGSVVDAPTAAMYIVNPFAKVKLSALSSTHPPTADRIKAHLVCRQS